MFPLQAVSSLGRELETAGAKNASCQSDKLSRPKGSIYCEPCSGLCLKPGSLIELVAPVYGLSDALFLWHRILTSFFGLG
eukprot:431133-Pyramimonas_sp.AAC.1